MDGMVNGCALAAATIVNIRICAILAERMRYVAGSVALLLLLLALFVFAVYFRSNYTQPFSLCIRA